VNAVKKLIAIATAIGGVVYFFDPQQGGARRARLRERLSGLFGGRAGAFEGGGEAANDETLTQRVQSELFRDDDVPKGQINVNAQDGVVQLRGEVPSEDMIGDLAERARSVQGVRDVENLLHTPGQPAPMHQ
jgi:hyperosmotically inducible periplasmic protein